VRDKQTDQHTRQQMITKHVGLQRTCYTI